MSSSQSHVQQGEGGTVASDPSTPLDRATNLAPTLASTSRSDNPYQGADGQAGVSLPAPVSVSERTTGIAARAELRHIQSDDNPTERAGPRADYKDDPGASDNAHIRKGDYGDSSSALWSLYLTEVQKEDKLLTDNMAANTNGVLVFTGLFAAIVAAFIIESYKLLQPDSGVDTVVLLRQISRQLAAVSNGSIPNLPPVPLGADSTTFRVDRSSLRINILWFLSLSLSLACALFATLMQQWARRYLSTVQDAQRAASIQKHGRIHAYMFMGLRSFRMKTAIEILPALLHISVALFFAGLVDFLFTINRAVAIVTLSFAGIVALAYLVFSILPYRWSNSPYATPLSTFPTSYIASSIIRIVYRALNHLSHKIYASDPKDSMDDNEPPPASLFDSLLRAVRPIKYHVTLARRRLSGCINLMLWSVLERHAVLQMSKLDRLDTSARAMSRIESSTLDWTLATVFDDDALVATIAAGLPGLLASAAAEGRDNQVVGVLHSREFGMRIGQVVQGFTSLDQDNHAESGNLAAHTPHLLSILRCIHGLLTDGRNALISADCFPLGLALLQLARSDDAEIAVHAYCAAVKLNHLIWKIGGSVNRHTGYRKHGFQSYGLGYAGDPLGQAGFWELNVSLHSVKAFVEAMVPRLGSVSGDSHALVWEALSTALSTAATTMNDETYLIDVVLVKAGAWAELNAMRPQIIAEADEIGKREFASLVDGELPLGSPMKSPYTRFYDELRPFYDWLKRYGPRREDVDPALLPRSGSRSSSSLYLFTSTSMSDSHITRDHMTDPGVEASSARDSASVQELQNRVPEDHFEQPGESGEQWPRSYDWKEQADTVYTLVRVEAGDRKRNTLVDSEARQPSTGNGENSKFVAGQEDNPLPLLGENISEGGIEMERIQSHFSSPGEDKEMNAAAGLPVDVGRSSDGRNWTAEG